MGVYDAPQWLLPAFVRSVEAVGGTAQPDEIRATGSSLIDRWDEPERRFHNLKHLVSVLARVDELTEETHEPDIVRLAAWYHGAVFDSAIAAQLANKAGEDEAASADIALRELVALGVPEPRARRVHDLVIHLARHTPDPADPDSAVLCDADLAMLAVEPQRYKAYLEDLHAEYAHVPRAEFLCARRRILRKLLARASLFVSPLSERWEEPARQNLAAELARVDKELAKLEAGDAASDGPAPDEQPAPPAGPERTNHVAAGARADLADADRSPGLEAPDPAEHEAPGSAGATAEGPSGAAPGAGVRRIGGPVRPLVAVIPKGGPSRAIVSYR